jgi:hypothetical protein
VLAFSYVVLLIVLRSVLLPLKAVIMNVLSVAAAYGVLVIVFQYGWTDSIIGFDHLGYVNALTPPLLLAIVFGLSMDYEVFLLSRIRERYQATGDNRLAVSQGLAASAKTISSAAIIMVAVFAIFALTGPAAGQGDRRRPRRGDLPRRDARAPGPRPGHDGAHGQVELVAARLPGPHPARHGLREQRRAGGRARRRRAPAGHDLASAIAAPRPRRRSALVRSRSECCAAHNSIIEGHRGEGEPAAVAALAGPVASGGARRGTAAESLRSACVFCNTLRRAARSNVGLRMSGRGKTDVRRPRRPKVLQNTRDRTPKAHATEDDNARRKRRRPLFPLGDAVSAAQRHTRRRPDRRRGRPADAH